MSDNTTLHPSAVGPTFSPIEEIINDILEVKQDATGIKADIKNRLKPKDVFDDDDDVFDK